MATRKGNTPKTTTDTNPDPITGEPGTHPVGTGLGAAAAGAAAGAAGAAVAGPAGAAVGVIVGAAVGGYAGKEIAESIDPTAEDAYWREQHMNRPYYEKGMTYDQDYAPAYRHGWESRTRHVDRTWDQVETDLARDWDRVKGRSRLGWERAKSATRDAWDRFERAMPSDLDKDGR